MNNPELRFACSGLVDTLLLPPIAALHWGLFILGSSVFVVDGFFDMNFRMTTTDLKSRIFITTGHDLWKKNIGNTT
jgi:hypothetical protein